MQQSPPKWTSTPKIHDKKEEMVAEFAFNETALNINLSSTLSVSDMKDTTQTKIGSKHLSQFDNEAYASRNQSPNALKPPKIDQEESKMSDSKFNIPRVPSPEDKQSLKKSTLSRTSRRSSHSKDRET